MIRGLYTSATGMLANEVQMNTLSNNLANADTNGYKRDQTVKETFPEMLLSRMEKGKQPVEIGTLNNGVAIAGNYSDFTQGSFTETGSELDLAIEGDGFFVVDTPQGVRYTRDGSFSLNEAGVIVDKSGYPVMGQEGILQTIPDESVSIGDDGVVRVNELEVDTIQLVDFADLNDLEKVGDNLYQTDQPVQGAENYSLHSGALEMANVKIVQEMVSIIEATRNYESNQKAIQTADMTLDKAVNEVGRLR